MVKIIIKNPTDSFSSRKSGSDIMMTGVSSIVDVSSEDGSNT